jgi:hypothetical protein
MALRPGPPLFLAKASYRQRRVRDALKIMPWFGALLFLIPLLWQRSGAEAQSTSGALVYLFGCWLVLIVIAYAISRVMRPEEPSTVPEVPDEGADAGP